MPRRRRWRNEINKPQLWKCKQKVEKATALRGSPLFTAQPRCTHNGASGSGGRHGKNDSASEWERPAKLSASIFVPPSPTKHPKSGHAHSNRVGQVPGAASAATSPPFSPSTRRGFAVQSELIPANRCLVIFNTDIEAACSSHDALAGILQQLRIPGVLDVPPDADAAPYPPCSLRSANPVAHMQVGWKIVFSLPEAASAALDGWVQWSKTQPPDFSAAELRRLERTSNQSKDMKHQAATTPAKASASNTQAQSNSRTRQQQQRH